MLQLLLWHLSSRWKETHFNMYLKHHKELGYMNLKIRREIYVRF